MQYTGHNKYSNYATCQKYMTDFNNLIALSKHK